MVAQCPGLHEAHLDGRGGKKRRGRAQLSEELQNNTVQE